MDVNKLLEERGTNYGDFKYQAANAQAIKRLLRSMPNWAVLPDVHREAIETIAIKLSRMLTGDWTYRDNAADICGYSQLMLEYMEKENIGGSKNERVGQVQGNQTP